MELRQLRYFLAVAEHGSILQGSRALHVTQPSVTVQIKALEQELGVTLFERRPRGVLLTREGRLLEEHARGILDAVKVGKEAVGDHGAAPAGRVVIGVPSSLVELLAVPLIERLSEKLPQVRVRLVESMSGYILDWICAGTIDLGLAFNTSDMHSVDREPLAEETLFFACSRNDPMADIIDQDRTVRLRQLAGATLVLTGPDNGLRRLIDSTARREGVELTVAMEIDSFSALCALVQRGRGQTIQSQAALARLEARDRMATARVVEPRIRRTVYLCYRRGQPLSRAALAAKELLLETLERMVDVAPWSEAVGRTGRAVTALVPTAPVGHSNA